MVAFLDIASATIIAVVLIGAFIMLTLDLFGSGRGR